MDLLCISSGKEQSDEGKEQRKTSRDIPHNLSLIYAFNPTYRPPVPSLGTISAITYGLQGLTLLPGGPVTSFISEAPKK